MPNVEQTANTRIWVTFQLPGIHRYPNAPEEVAYLRNEHRHMFHFKVTLTVFHDDREIEFHMMKNWILGLYGEQTLTLNHKSCEMMAAELLGKVVAKFGHTYHRDVEVEVSEDGECGAIVREVQLIEAGLDTDD